MEVEDALIAQDYLASATSSPVVSEDEDAVNTESARIYFGPITSPEKKLARKHDPSRRTPIRRSKRLSSAPRLLQHMTLQGSEPSDGTPGIISERSGSSTPDAFEEPSSILASKILRASVNPSPPPRSPGPTTLDDVHDAGNEGNSAPNDSISPLLAQKTLPEVEHDIESKLPPSNVDPSAEDPVVINEDVEQDLITFDTSNTLDTPPVPLPPKTPSNASDTRIQGIVTVDDLLFSSPMRPLDGPLAFPSSLGHIQIPSAQAQPTTDEVTSTVDDEKRVLQELVDGSSDTPATPLVDLSEMPAEVLAQNEPLPPLIKVDAIPGLDESELPNTSTPLRRSSRPRRSCSPLVVPLTSLSPPKPVQKEIDAPPVVVGPARRKSLKGKEREIVVISDAEDEPSLYQPAGDPRLISIAEDALSRRSRSPQRRTVSSSTRLGSLSPTSAVVLSQLLPAPSEDQVESGLGEDLPVDASSEIPTSTPLQSIPEVHTPPPPSREPPASPPKLPDVTRTPARRVPIAQALREGTVSPHKPLALPTSSNIDSQPAPFIRQALDDPNRSPAKRILLPQPIPSSSKLPPLRLHGSQLPTPGRPTVFRSRSEEPQPLGSLKPKRSTSLEPTQGTTSTSTAGKDGFFKGLPGASSITQPTQRPKPLPHPIIPTQSRIPSSIPEGDENEIEPITTKPQTTSPPKNSPSKPSSSLRQPTSRLDTKIPRFGAKPYARPATARPLLPKPAKPVVLPSQLQAKPVAPKNAGPKPIVPIMVANRPPEQPIRMRKAMGRPVVVSGSSSDDQSGPNTAGPGPSTTASRTNMSTTSSTSTIPPRPEVTVLKRKREEVSRASPPGVKPIVLVRRVQSTMNAAKKVASPSPLRSPLKQKATQETNETAPRIQMRRAVGAPKAKMATPSPPHGVVEESRSPAVDSILESPGPQPVSAVRREKTPPPKSSPPPAPSTPIPNESPEPPTSIPPETPSQPEPPSPAPEISTEPSEAPAGSARGVRRTTRARKSSQPTSDVFGAIAEPQPVIARRRTRSALETTFFGMTATALRSLTSANTQRNQDYVVKLETEVVRVEGKRPDSPTTKVKSSLDQQKEQRDLQRQQRAERRARRGGDPDTTLDSAADMSLDILDFEEGDVSTMDIAQNLNALLEKHRRGPGDEEDYESPPRPERVVKRGRLEEQSEEKNEKRVKWDRGLSTTVYLDDGPPNPSRKHREEFSKRGCLASTAKTLRLDNMGNVLNADMPLTGLVAENITVKKFVYDDDLPPEPVPAPVKATRSKSKKAKS